MLVSRAAGAGRALREAFHPAWPCSVQQRRDIGHAVGHGGDQGTVVQAGQAQLAGPGVQFPGELTELGRSHRLVGPTAC